jgi:hypothetical protein
MVTLMTRLMVMRHVDHRMVVPVVMPNMMVDMTVMQFMMGHVADHNRHVDYRMVVLVPQVGMMVMRFMVMQQSYHHMCPLDVTFCPLQLHSPF